MIIGIVSDTHGNARRLKMALEVFIANSAQAVVHCGDIGSLECVELLEAAPVPAYLVAGNVDRHVERLEATCRQGNIHFAWEVVVVDIDRGRHLAATHGHNDGVLGELIAGGQFPYVCHGHSHCLRDERIADVRVINPGALQRAARPTVAILDTQADKLVVCDIRDASHGD